jgi:hypothetical protein
MNIPPLSSLKLYAKRERGYAKNLFFERGKVEIYKNVMERYFAEYSGAYESIRELSLGEQDFAIIGGDNDLLQ